MEISLSISNKLNFHIDNEVSKRNCAQGIRVMKQTPLKKSKQLINLFIEIFYRSFEVDDITNAGHNS